MQTYEKITAKDYDVRVIEKPYAVYKKEYYTDPVQFNKLKRTLKRVHVKKKKVLELGCSLGFFSFELARAGADVTAVDYSFHSLHIANQFLKEERNKGLTVHFYRRDARNLKFPSDYFDLIVNYDFIEHIYPQDQKQVIQEMFRVLKKGGAVVTYTPNYNRVRMEYYLQKTIRWLNGKSWGWQQSDSGVDHQDTKLHVGLLSLNELITLLEQNGFGCIFSDDEEYSFPGVRWLNQFKILPNLFNANSFIFCKK